MGGRRGVNCSCGGGCVGGGFVGCRAEEERDDGVVLWVLGWRVGGDR